MGVVGGCWGLLGNYWGLLGVVEGLLGDCWGLLGDCWRLLGVVGGGMRWWGKINMVKKKHFKLKHPKKDR